MFDVFFKTNCNQVDGDEIEIAECCNGDIEISINDSSVILDESSATMLANAIIKHYEIEEK
jgi:phosphoribosylformylglycinamidine (FGAM) synthase PurS component